MMQELDPATKERLQEEIKKEIAEHKIVFYGKGTKEIAHLLGISTKTLEKHRALVLTKMGVESAAPSVVVLVGEAAFKELTRSDVGPQLLMRVYQTAFQEVSQESGYNVESMAAGIVAVPRADG